MGRGERVQLDALSPRLRAAVLARCARQALRRWGQDWGATGVGFGRRQRAGALRDEWCLKIYVPRKLSRSRRVELVPGALEFRVSVDKLRYRVRVPTDVVAIAPRSIAAQALASPIFNENEPAAIGSATGWVRDTERDRRYLLAAGHVVARSLSQIEPPLGDRVVDRNGDVVGTLARAPGLDRIPLDVGFLDPTELDPVPRPSGTSVQGVRAIESLAEEVGERFWLLSWRRRKPARFVGIVYDYAVEGQYAVGTVVFRTLIHLEAASQGGDSGALVIDAEGRATGMHILGVASESVAFALPVDEILARAWPRRRLELDG